MDTSSSIGEILGGKCRKIKRSQFRVIKVKDIPNDVWNLPEDIFITINISLLFRMLLRLLEQSKEPLVLCVAAHDVGEYVRHYPHGKK